MVVKEVKLAEPHSGIFHKDNYAGVWSHLNRLIVDGEVDQYIRFLESIPLSRENESVNGSLSL